MSPTSEKYFASAVNVTTSAPIPLLFISVFIPPRAIYPFNIQLYQSIGEAKRFLGKLLKNTSPHIPLAPPHNRLAKREKEKEKEEKRGKGNFSQGRTKKERTKDEVESKREERKEARKLERESGARERERNKRKGRTRSKRTAGKASTRTCK